MKSFDLDVREPPGFEWRRRLAVLVVGSVGYLGMLATWPASSLHTAATPTPSGAAAPPAAAPATTTTVDPKAIAAGVATLLSHEGATPQELAAAPSSAHHAGGVRHGRTGGIHVHG